ncbi:MAG: pyrroline-5-carboxylate reductase [Victivallales bacterium]|nr:pyrroline-5-carboxylate reductase [Victivallales bacterium]
MKLKFIGAGKMATAIATGIIEQKVFPRGSVSAVDVSPDARRTFIAATGTACLDPSSLKSFCETDILILAVKPQSIIDVFAKYSNSFDGALLVSIVAGVKLSKLEELSGMGRIVRVMPNTPLLVGAGASVYSCASGASEEDEGTVETIFGSLGLVRKMPEDSMDAVTALSGSGPAYVFEFVQALADAGRHLGLDPEVSLALAVQTLSGAAKMLVEGKGTPEELRKAVTSPGGTTAAALEVLCKGDFRGLIETALIAARDRSIELGNL